MADTYRVRVTAYAKEQLNGISDYILDEYKSPTTARNISKRLRDAIKSLSFMPSRIAFVDEEPWSSYGIHKMVEGNYLIYFWIDENSRMVIVTGIVNVRMEQSPQLERMDLF